MATENERGVIYRTVEKTRRDRFHLAGGIDDGAIYRINT